MFKSGNLNHIPGVLINSCMRKGIIVGRRSFLLFSERWNFKQLKRRRVAMMRRQWSERGVFNCGE